MAAAADELTLEHPNDAVDTATVAVILGGPALFLIGTGPFKRALWGYLPRSRVLALLAQCALIPLAFTASALVLGAAATAVVVAVAWSDSVAARRPADQG